MGMLIYINRVSSYLDKKSRLVMVQSRVLSHCNHGLSVCGTAVVAGLSDRVQRQPNFAARVDVGGVCKVDPVSRVHKDLSGNSKTQTWR